MESWYANFIAFVLSLIVGAIVAISYFGSASYLGINVSHYQRLVMAAVILVFGYLSVRFLSHSIVEYGRHRPRTDEKPLSKIVSLIGYLIIFFFLLSVFRINLTGVLISAGFLGIVIGLASQSTLGNLFAGIAMMASKPFANGDRITFSTWQYGTIPPSYAHRVMLPGYSGQIKEIGLIYTKVGLDDGTSIFVPNGVMNQAAIINYAISDTIQVNFRVELQIAVPFEKLRKDILNEISRRKRLSGSIKGKPEVRITDVSVSTYGIDVQAGCTIENEDYVKSEITRISLKVAKVYGEQAQKKK